MGAGNRGSKEAVATRTQWQQGSRCRSRLGNHHPVLHLGCSLLQPLTKMQEHVAEGTILSEGLWHAHACSYGSVPTVLWGTHTSSEACRLCLEVCSNWFIQLHSDCCKVERDRKIARTPNHKEPCTARLQRCSLGTERETLGLHNRARLQSRPFSGKLRWWLHAANLPLLHRSSRSLLLPVVDKGVDGSSTRRRSVHPRCHPLPVLVLQWSVWYSGSELII